ncbi:MAG: phosphodiesterase [Desulfocapsa sp.]|uniref:Phosphodiesterase n=1 Tax=Desulfotalea psychrophila TaxID=84980 RepID=A0ABS3AT26_9BACT|nr:phosphodiesterase [Desulfocapsa sp.]MBN4067921.1 phosphodiesterase [Desulfotalea psychrophila]
MLIAHISDTHIAGKNKNAYGVVPTAANLELCVANINQLAPNPDLVLVTGDITCNGLLEESKRAAAILRKLRSPYYIVPGNHDDRSTLLSAFGQNACPVENNTFIHYVIEGYDIRLIALDTSSPGQSGGEICETRLSWLEEQLSLKKDKATILFMHHPPAKCRVLETDKDTFIGVGKLGDLIKKHQNIKRILCGHIHMSAHLEWYGTVISVAPSMGLEIVLDLTLKRPSEFTMEAPAYQLHYLTPENNLVSHLITVKDKDGPYRFKEYPESMGLH